MAEEKRILKLDVVKADVVTPARRIYSAEVLKKAVADVQGQVNERRMLGTLGNTEDGKIDLRKVSHLVKSITFEDGKVVGEVEILDTEKGKILKDLLDRKVEVAMRPEGVGHVFTDDKGVELVQDFQLTNIVIVPVIRLGKEDPMKRDGKG